MEKRAYHIDTIEYLITGTYAEAKGYLFNLFFGWRKTDSNDMAYFYMSNKDWEIIDIKIRYYYTFVKKEK